MPSYTEDQAIETLGARRPEVGTLPGRGGQQSADPWKHRAVGMTCATCMWYLPKVSTYEGAAKVGRCRRHAPTMSGYPAVFPADWCGDHKLDETKLE